MHIWQFELRALAWVSCGRTIEKWWEKGDENARETPTLENSDKRIHMFYYVVCRLWRDKVKTMTASDVFQSIQINIYTYIHMT